MFMSKML